MPLVIFWLLAIVSVTAAILMVVNRNPVRSALFLVLTFLCVAVFYVTLSAQFLAAVQVIVYAGAIMVLFLFVIMLLNLGAPDLLRERGTIQTLPAIGLGGLFIVALAASRSLIKIRFPRQDEAIFAKMGTVQGVGLALFDQNKPWLFPFEATSILLLVAIVGAIVMAKRRV